MKTQEELNELKQEYESLTTKLKELTEDELIAVTGGSYSPPTPKLLEMYCVNCGDVIYTFPDNQVPRRPEVCTKCSARYSFQIREIDPHSWAIPGKK